MNGEIGNLTENKCDAILCRPGFSSPLGRQNSVNTPCQPCPGADDDEREEQAPYYGMLACTSTSKERKTLTQLHDLIFTGKLEIIRTALISRLSLTLTFTECIFRSIC